MCLLRILLAAQSRIIGLIGRLSKDYPDCIENNSADAGIILDMFFKVLEGVAINKHDVRFLFYFSIFL